MQNEGLTLFLKHLIIWLQDQNSEKTAEKRKKNRRNWICGKLVSASGYLKANLAESAKASGTKRTFGKISSSGFQSNDKFSGRLGNL